MDGNSKNFVKDTHPAERPLIDAAWVQFQTLAARRKPSSTEARRALNIPGYRVLNEIHRGGQGVVYQAVQESTHRKVAIKVLKEGPLADPNELASRKRAKSGVAPRSRYWTPPGQAAKIRWKANSSWTPAPN